MTERITCKRYCVCWNDIDKDCELFGEHHPCPRKCPHYIRNYISETGRIEYKISKIGNISVKEYKEEQ